MTDLNVYMCGVGGQGIGVLAEVVIQACMKAGHIVRGVDTHGLAQRGGVVVSHLRLGPNAYTPRIMPGEADVVIALERLEAYRAVCTMLKTGGSAIYYDVAFQPIDVRMGRSNYPSEGDIEQACSSRDARLERVLVEDMPDTRMQNVALLGRLASLGLIPGVKIGHFEDSLREVLPQYVLDQNLEVFRQAGMQTASS